MGVYRTLFAELECQRCDATFRTDIQFYTGNDRQMQTYEIGIPIPSEDELQSGSYEGCSDRFCSACLELWQKHEADAFGAALFQLVERDDLRVTRAGCFRNLLLQARS